jgi:hypothetical protein
MLSIFKILLVLVFILLANGCSSATIPAAVYPTDTVIPLVSPSSTSIPIVPSQTFTIEPTISQTQVPTSTRMINATIRQSPTYTMGVTSQPSKATFTTIPNPDPVSLVITSVTSPVKQGAVASLSALTNPGASCSITVYLKSGPSTARGLEPKDADSSGNVSWSWKVGSSTTPGTWRIVLKCTSDGENVTRETTFIVQK